MENNCKLCPACKHDQASQEEEDRQQAAAAQIEETPPRYPNGVIIGSGCPKSCGPGDFKAGGKCDINGCFSRQMPPRDQNAPEIFMHEREKPNGTIETVFVPAREERAARALKGFINRDWL